jgi:hypothetical protein
MRKSLDSNSLPIIIYKADNHWDDIDTEDKGYRNDVLVKLPGGEIVEVFFFDKVRLLQEMGDSPFLAKPGLIILSIVNKASISNAVINLYERGYFDYFKSRSSIDQNHFEEEI